MLTLADINRALDQLGPGAFIPRTRRELAVDVAAGSVRLDRDRGRAVSAPPRGPAVVVLARWRLSRGDATPAPSSAVRTALRASGVQRAVTASQPETIVPFVPGHSDDRISYPPRDGLHASADGWSCAAGGEQFEAAVVPELLVRLDRRRMSSRRPGWSSKIEWFVVGSATTLLLLFFVGVLLR